MEVIPAIDVLGGRCVRLEQGDYDRQTVFSDQPQEVARRWAEHGAQRIHVVDLDGAKSGAPVNQPTIKSVVGSVGIPVQVGGGIRTREAVNEYLSDITADRVVLGTAAIRDEGLIRAVCEDWPDRIVIAVDARDGMVAVQGWLETSNVTATDLIDRMVASGASRFLYTDISRDGMLSEPNFEAISRLTLRGDIQIIASGGVAKIDHVRRLAEIGADAVIIGRALYTGDVDLGEAIRAAGQ